MGANNNNPFVFYEVKMDSYKKGSGGIVPFNKMRVDPHGIVER